jgi:hypothetical protein
MAFDLYAMPHAPVRALFLRSDYASPDEIRPELPNFEKFCKTIRVSLQGPSNKKLWFLKFTDLEKKIEPGTGRFEEYYFNLLTLHDGRLWEIYSDQPREIFAKTVYRLIDFSSKLEHVFIPPNFIHELMEKYGDSQEMTSFSAKRDYFKLTITNPKLIPIRDFASLRYKSANVPRDYQILVIKDRPVGPLMLNSADLLIRSGQKKCKIRINIEGFLSQVGKGDWKIYMDVREKLLQFLEKQEGWKKYFPKIETEEIEDEEKGIIIRSKKIVQVGRPFVIKLSSNFDVSSLSKFKVLFTSNIRESQFVGSVEKETPDEAFMIKTTDLRGGGDALITAEIGKSDVIISPTATTSIRTLERIYRVILEKFDVDAIFVGPTD